MLILEEGRLEYNQLYRLYNFFQVFFADSVLCERNFSLMNVIKTELRNRIENDLLLYLLNIKCNSKLLRPDRTKFIEDTIDYWNEVKKRYFYRK